jgi:tetratricopeptide (TPR) repeat protein
MMQGEGAMPERTPKQVVAELLNTWVKRAGLTKEQVAARANLADANELYRHYLDQSRNLSTHPAAALAVVLAFRQNLPAQTRCTAAEAISFLILTQLPLDRYPEVQRAGGFGAAEWQAALAAHGMVLAHDTAPPPQPEALERLERMERALAAQQEAAQARRREELHARLHHHTGFLHDRLASFVGREAELGEVRRHIAELLPTGGYVTITAPAGQGKSSLIAKLVEQELRERCGAGAAQAIEELVRQDGPAALAYHFIPFSPGPDHQVGLLRNLMARLILKYDLPDIYVATDSRPALRDYFARVLEEVAARGGQEVIYIDGLDQIEEDASGVRDLSFLPTKPPEGIVFVLGTRPNDTLQPLELRKPHQQYWLPPLSRTDFDLVLQHRQVNLDAHLADRFYRVMEANALYLDLVARELAEAEALAPEQIIARIADNPDSLFSLAIERLKRPALEWRTLIKPILGTLLAAQEPLAAASIRAIIGQEDEAVRATLVRLGGLLARDGQGRSTLFHLKLRDFLREDLQHPDRGHIFAADEEQDEHQKLADWCECGGLSGIWQDYPQDAREQERRAYARQHFITHLCRALNWPRLWETLDQGKYGKAKLRHDPSTRSFVLDLDTVRQAMIAAASKGMLEGTALAPRLWRYSLLRCSLSNQANTYPEGLIELLAQLGHQQEAIGLAEMLTDPALKIQTLARMSKILGQQERLVEQQQVLSRAVEILRAESCLLLEHQLQNVAVALAEAQQVEVATKVARQASDAEMRAWALVAVAEVLAQQGQRTEACLVAQEAADTVRLSVDMRVRSRLLYRAASVLMQLGVRAEALMLVKSAIWSAQRIRSAEMRAEALARVAGMLADEEYSEALALAQTAVEQAQHITAPRERSKALQTVARVLEQLGLHAEAFALIEEAIETAHQSANVQVLDEALQSAAQTHARAGQVATALELAYQIADPVLRAKILQFIAGVLVNAQHTEAHTVIQEASALARHIVDLRVRVQVLLGLTRVLILAHHSSAQYSLLQEATETAWQITDATARAQVLQEVARSLASVQRPGEALAMIQEIVEMTRQTEQPSAWQEAGDTRIRALTEIAEVLVAAQQHEQACICAQKAAEATTHITETRNQIWTLGRVAQALIAVHQPEKARVFIQQAIKTMQLTPNAPIWGMQAHQVVAEALAAMQQGVAAAELASQITAPWEQAWVLRGVAQRCAEAQQVPIAIEIAGQIAEAQVRAEALGDVIEVLIANQQYDQARSLAQKITEAVQQIVDKHIRANTLRRVVQVLATINQERGVIQVARQTPDAKMRAHMLGGLAQGLASIQQYEKATDLAQEAVRAVRQSQEVQAEDLADVAWTLAQAQQYTDALVLVQEAVQAARQVKNTRERASALQTLARTLALVHRYPETFALIREVAETVRQTTHVQVQMMMLANAARVLFQIQEHGEALALIREVIEMGRQCENHRRRFGILQYLTQILKEEAYWDEVVSIVQEMTTVARTDHTSVSYDRDLSNLIRTLPHLPTVLTLVQRLWSQAQTRDDLYDLLPAAAPLFVADPTLLPQILAGEEWVKDQLRW